MLRKILHRNCDAHIEKLKAKVNLEQLKVDAMNSLQADHHQRMLDLDKCKMDLFKCRKELEAAKEEITKLKVDTSKETYQPPCQPIQPFQPTLQDLVTTKDDIKSRKQVRAEKFASGYHDKGKGK